MEQASSDTYPFEIHITVSLPPDNTLLLDAFRERCREISVKPIVIEMQDQRGAPVLRDVQTSSKYEGCTEGAISKAHEVAEMLRETGFDVVREKVESVPWHPLAPAMYNEEVFTPGQYFEAHFPIVTPHDRLEDLGRLAVELNCHRSRNVFKKLEDGLVIMMLTFRTRTVKEAFESSVESIVATLIKNGFVLPKLELEFALYDSKLSHDDQWLGMRG